MTDIKSVGPAWDGLSSVQKALMPNLFIIGAGKAGTTSLHSYLSEHPEITGSTQKEPSFFVAPRELRRHQLLESMRPEANSLDAYLGLFSGGGTTQYRLESSPTYASYPEFTGVPERIVAASPQARIIFLVRNPVDRAISHYWQDRKILKEDRSLVDAMAGESLYTWCSDYKLQLDRYRPYFGGQILVVVSEDLRADPSGMLASIFSFLELPAFEVDIERLGERNKTAVTTRMPRFRFVTKMRDTAAWNRVRDHLPNGVVESIRQIAVKNVPRDVSDEAAVRDILYARFDSGIKELDAAYGTNLHARWFGSAARTSHPVLPPHH